MEVQEKDDVFSATEGQTTVAFSDWTKKLKFDRSFTAKLILSDEKTKGFYVEIATALLSYEKVRSTVGWSGVSFTRGRERAAFIAIVGKTLCVYLAEEIEDSESRYKAKDVSAVKKRAKTPALYKIKSNGAKNYLLARIDGMASVGGWTKKTDGEGRVFAHAFKTDTFQNLITRGLIRVIRSNTSEKNAPSFEETEKNESRKKGLFEDTADVVGELFSRHGAYGNILKTLSEGEGSASFTQRKILRSVDEIWVRAIEDCISSLDELIRNPNHFIAETEEVLPIEKTKRVSGRSIVHLCRHTDYLSVGRDGDMTPTKMLNVFREDSLLTYENKFLNTLVHRLYTFVSRRYKIAEEYGADEKTDAFTFENNFTHGEGKGRVVITVEYSERNLDKNAKKVLSGTGLWQRVERLHDIVTGYIHSSFCKEMDRNFVKPPILRTNAIIKNKYFRECLALWEFIESYDDAGYGIVVEEKSKELSAEHIRAAYEGAAMQYALFRRAAEEGFEEEEESFSVEPTLRVSERREEKKTEEFWIEKDDEAIDDDITFALQVALAADEKGRTGEERSTFMRKSFPAKLRSADEELKERYVALSNALLAYKKVRMRESLKYAAFYYGRKPLLKITIGGKALKLYFALDSEKMPQKYFATDVSDKKSFADTPTCLKVKGKRSVLYAQEAIKLLAQEYDLTKGEGGGTLAATDYKEEPLVDMLQKGWITFATKKEFTGGYEKGISFGSVKNKKAEELAKAVETLSVSEGKTALYERDKTPTERTAESERTAREIANLIRPTGNYEKPTEYGLDDATAFITDDMQSKDREEDEEKRQ